MIKKIMKIITDLSLKKKILAITIVVNILFVGIVSILGIGIVIEANNKLLYQSIASSLSYSATDIEDILDSVQTLSNIMLADDVIQTHLSIVKSSQEDTLARRNAYKYLYTAVQNYYLEFRKNHISYISLHNDYFTTDTYMDPEKKAPVEVIDDLIQTSILADGSPVWTTSYAEKYGLFLSRAVRKIENLSLDIIGVMNICLDIDGIIESSTDFSNQYEESFYLLFDQDELVYHSSHLSEQDAEHILNQLHTPYGIIPLNNHKYFAVKGSLPTFQWDYICLVSYDQTYHSILFSYKLYFLIMLGSILLSILLSNILIRRIIKHLDNLIIKMRHFRGQDAEIIDVGYDYQNRGDELGVLHRQFGSMASEIQELIEVNYLHQLLMKDSQIKALEAQINPHFLYNILESVNWRAKAIGEKQISSMVEALGSLLRATLSQKEESFSLAQELELVQNYMTIQQIRFDEQLHFLSNVDPTLLHGRIPKLTIQPILENAIHHALEANTEECYICLTATLQDKDLVIFVRNSGSQFEEDLLEKLASKKIQPRGFGIGLLNIDKRLKLTFGDSYGLSLYNENQNAVACITIPFQTIHEKERSIC